MIRILSTLWRWLTGRPSAKTATSTVPPIQPPAPGPSGWPGTGISLQPLERSIETASIEGLHIELRYEESRYRGPDGEIIRYCRDGTKGAYGCGHTGELLKAAGLCVYCVREYQCLVEGGQMHPLEAERLSMVCSDCAQMTTSGHLSCPKHRIAVVGPTGTTQYVDADTAKHMARKDTVGKAVNTFVQLFGTSQQPESKKE